MDTHTLEDARSCSESKRKHKKMELIHKVMLEQRVSQLAHARLQQTLAGFLLEFPDLLSNIPLDEPGVPLERLLQGS